MFELIKRRCGIAATIDTYDEDIRGYIEDCKEEMIDSGVPPNLIQGESQNQQVITAITLYVKAHLGNDRTDTEKYLDLYRKKVFRLTMGDENVE